MIVDLNQICSCGAELVFDSNIDGHDRELMSIDSEYLYKIVCPNCRTKLQFRHTEDTIE